MTKKSPNWDIVEAEYVSSDQTYRELAAKYGVTLRQLQRYGKDRGWVEKRFLYRHDLATKCLQVTTEKVVDNVSECVRLAYEADLNILNEIKRRTENLTDATAMDLQKYHAIATDYITRADEQLQGDVHIEWAEEMSDYAD